MGQVKSGIFQAKKDLKVVTDKFNEHLANEYPHNICRLETQKVDMILKSVEKLGDRFDVLDDRIVKLIERKGSQDD